MGQEACFVQQLYAKVIDQEGYQGIKIQNSNNEFVGDIFKATVSGCDDKNTYGFKHANGLEVILGLQLRRFKDFNVAKYTVECQGEHFTLKEKKLRNFMNFQVDGVINDQSYVFKDDKEVTLIMYKNNDLIATMDDRNIYVEEVSYLETGLLVLMYFMYKLYKREDYHLARLLHRSW